MKITSIKATPVRVPYKAAFGSSLGISGGTTRTIVQMETDTGLVGIGETMRGKPAADLIDRIAEVFIGKDPHSLEALLDEVRMVPFFHGYIGYAAIGALEMACWDLIGKARNAPLYDLLGGMYRREIPITGVLANLYATGPHGTQSFLEGIVRSSRDLVDEFKFTTLKQKGSKDWEFDCEVMEALQEEHPKGIRFRLDPNWAWSVEDSIRVAERLRDLNMDWLEDPTYGIEGMARVRERSSIPLSTNMCVVTYEDIPPAVRLKAVDVILGDCHKWGGIVPTKKLAAVCEVFGLGMGLHSGGELGISTAANLHITASTPVIRYAIDSLYYLLEYDIITKPFELVDGCMVPPTGPGLGVELDEDAFKEAAALYEVEGETRV